MGLLSFFKREDKPPGAGSSEAGDAVREARTRARRRLIGAVVLLVIGVIGFPLVFETRPRPIPVDIPIEIPRKDAAAPLPMPPARPVATASAAARTVPTKPRDEVITETPAEAGREIPSRPTASTVDGGPAGEKSAPSQTTRKSESAVASVEAARNPAAPAPEVTRKAPAVAAAAAETPPRKAQETPADGARARALLEAKPAAAADGGRYVVQVGAFAEADAARETRARVEKLGMKTYTQVAQTPAGSRIRVRVGPFGTRAEADAALARARAAGLNAVVLTL